ncbi:MAG: glycerol-3-phosphate 1-O-acyltransferase PlsY [Acidobacteriaceae bacterium]
MSMFLLTAALSYLLGSIPFGYLLVLAFRKEDIRETGSGNIGATNVIRSGARWLGTATLLLDVAKGYVAVALSQFLLPAQHPPELRINVLAVAATFAVLGHVYPVWLGFKGGKGVATALGVYLALMPPAVLGAVALFLVVMLSTKYVSLASILAAASFPVFGAFMSNTALAFTGIPGPHWFWTPTLVACALIVPSILIAKHHANIRRLISRTEYRIGDKKRQSAL